MNQETSEEVLGKKQKRPVRLYAVVRFVEGEVSLIEAVSANEMKQQLGVLSEHAIVGLFRGRKIETKVQTRVSFKIN